MTRDLFLGTVQTRLSPEVHSLVSKQERENNTPVNLLVAE